MIMPLTVNQPLSASSFYPWVGASVFGLTEMPWFGKLSATGSSQAWFLGGALLSGFIFSVLKKEFKWRIIHSRWQHYKGNSVSKRLIYAFTGGFLLLFGARLAGGCTSGHIISGGMQLSFSSLLFAVFTFAGLLLTGRFFYRSR
jgi:uncharacterized protein